MPLCLHEVKKSGTFIYFQPDLEAFSPDLDTFSGFSSFFSQVSLHPWYVYGDDFFSFSFFLFFFLSKKGLYFKSVRLEERRACSQSCFTQLLKIRPAVWTRE